MASRYLQRLERLEAALRPIGRVFLLWDDYDGTIDEKIAACRAENDAQGCVSNVKSGGVGRNFPQVDPPRYHWTSREIAGRFRGQNRCSCARSCLGRLAPKSLRAALWPPEANLRLSRLMLAWRRTRRRSGPMVGARRAASTRHAASIVLA